LKLQLAIWKLASAAAPADRAKRLMRERLLPAVLEALPRLRAGVFFFLAVVIQAAMVRRLNAA